MHHLQTEVLVIGGGATGTGILRDLAMRGFKAILVEKRDLSHGTTGRYHGLLHSGGRYVVKDPHAARECIEENRILRRIMPHCIEDTGGFFVVTPHDDPEYASLFIPACRKVGIPVEEIHVSKMLAEEPLLNSKILRCFRVPDASADSFLASETNAESARNYNAQVLTYHEVKALIRTGDRIIGATCLDLVTEEPVEIFADIVINATGAWAGKIAATAGISINILPGKGVMLAINHRIVNTVINRCKMPSDGDIIVPAHTVAVLGTTDETVQDPDRFSIDPLEVRLLIDEGEKLIPNMRSLRILRAWAGVRPLYKDNGTAVSSRDLSRGFVLLDHGERDGVEGLVTITSGKWTTFRLMAQKTVDKICDKLKTQRECRTHLEIIPNADRQFHYLGSRLAKIEQTLSFGSLICECELATVDDVVKSIIYGKAKTIDDIRRETRLGMGPCQGGFCTLRAAGILHELTEPKVENTNAAIRDFLQERWKGLLPILSGSQLRQERLDELIYLNVLNIPALPGPHHTVLKSKNYLRPQSTAIPPLQETTEPMGPALKIGRTAADRADVLVIGGGFAGLVTAWQASQGKKSVSLATKGWGALFWATGAIDVLGYLPGYMDQPVIELHTALNTLIKMNPAHPYNLVGMGTLQHALEAFKDLCNQSGYPMEGTIDRNWLLPSAVGAARPTCLAPQTMIAGDLTNTQPMLILGFDGFNDFYPALIAANLTLRGISAHHLKIKLPMKDPQRQLTGIVLARLFDDNEFRKAFISQMKLSLESSNIELDGLRLGFPAVLGLQRAHTTWQQLSDQLNCPIFEIPGLPPSIPGMRLHKILQQSVERNGGKVLNGQQAILADCVGNRVKTVYTEAAARYQPHTASQYVLATGGILGGGVLASPTRVEETIFNLSLESHLPEFWFNDEFISPTNHPIYLTGLSVDQFLRPIKVTKELAYENLYAVGAALGGVDPLAELSIEGIALATGFAVGRKVGLDLD